MWNKKSQNPLADTGSDLLERGKELIREGNSRRIIIKSADNRVIFDTTLTIAAVIGAFILFFLPFGFPLLTIAVMVAVISRIRVDIVHETIGQNDVIEGELADKQQNNRQ